MSFYGPCECTPTSTINYDAQTPKDAIHLGKGAGFVTWLVDPENHDSLVPLGSVGELLLEGPLVGLGYLRDPERTAASFIEDSVWILAGTNSQPGRHGRFYKTGDLVRYRDDGSLIFVGRKDTQIKLRGQRIEPGEIEHVLRGHAGVDDAVAVLHREQGNDSKWITAFVTVRDPQAAFQGLFSVKQWERRLIGESTSTDGGYRSLPKRVSPGRDFRTWESMYNASDVDMKQIGRWLTATIKLTAKDEDASRLPEGWNGPEFVLFSLPTAVLPNTTFPTSHTGAVKFISKIIDSTPALEDTITVLQTAPADLGPSDLSRSCCSELHHSLVSKPRLPIERGHGSTEAEWCQDNPIWSCSLGLPVSRTAC